MYMLLIYNYPLERKVKLKEAEIQELNTEIIDAYGEKGIVLGDGKVNSRIVLIGEAPGKNEVELKKPFVGQAGKHLEEFLKAIDLKRDEIYITNVVKFRPTKASKSTGKEVNRTPYQKEITMFTDFLFRELDIIHPELIVTLGNVPLKTVVKDRDIKIGDVHGKLLNKNDEIAYNVFPLYHPAAVIYRRELKKVYMDDLKLLKDILLNKHI